MSGGENTFKVDNMSYNIIKIIRNSRKIRILKELCCDEKYTNEMASDFELFDEWERILPLIEGHRELLDYKSELSVLGLDLPEPSENTRRRSIERWRRLNEIELSFEEQEARAYFEAAEIKKSPPEGKAESIFDIDTFVSKNIIKYQSLPALSSFMCEEAKKLENSRIALVIDMLEGEYVRPDPHLAECVFNKIKSDELFNKCESLVMRLQLLVELILRLRSSRDISLIFRTAGNLNAASETLAYLRRRRIFGGEAYVEVNEKSSLSQLSDLVDTVYPRIFVRPLIDTASRISSTELERIYADYPRGAFVFRNLGALR